MKISWGVESRIGPRDYSSRLCGQLSLLGLPLRVDMGVSWVVKYSSAILPDRNPCPLIIWETLTVCGGYWELVVFWVQGLFR